MTTPETIKAAREALQRATIADVASRLYDRLGCVLFGHRWGEAKLGVAGCQRCGVWGFSSAWFRARVDDIIGEAWAKVQREREAR